MSNEEEVGVVANNVVLLFRILEEKNGSVVMVHVRPSLPRSLEGFEVNW